MLRGKLRVIDNSSRIRVGVRKTLICLRRHSGLGGGYFFCFVFFCFLREVEMLTDGGNFRLSRLLCFFFFVVVVPVLRVLPRLGKGS